MITVGKRTKAKYWGAFTVEKVVKLDRPVLCYSAEKGAVAFEPTIVKIRWDTVPSDDQHDLWFPYWVTVAGKQKFGQFAPMIGQKALLELMSKAIDDDFFGEEFLVKLHRKIADHLRATDSTPVS